MIASRDLLALICSFAGEPAHTAPVSKQLRHATYQALYIQWHALLSGCLLQKIGEDLGKWQHENSEGSIQRWLKARARAITIIQIRQPRLTDGQWRDVDIDPFHPFYWGVQDIRRAADAIQKNREESFVIFFEKAIQVADFQPPLVLSEHSSIQEKAAVIRSWIEANEPHIRFNRWEDSPFDFPPSELAPKLHPDILRSFFSHACYGGDFEFVNATLKTRSCRQTLAAGDDLIHSFSRLCELYPLIAKELLNNPHPSVVVYLEPARSVIIDVAVREGHFPTLTSFGNVGFDEGTILTKACYAGQSGIVKELLKRHHFSTAELGRSLFVTLEGPAVLFYLLPIPFIYPLFSNPLLSLLAYEGTLCCSFVAYHRFFPPEPRPAALNGESILSPTGKSITGALHASAYLFLASFIGKAMIVLAMPAFQDDRLSMISRIFRAAAGLGIPVFVGISTTVFIRQIIQLTLPRRSFSVLSGFCSAIRETAAGRLKAIGSLCSAIVKRIPCWRARLHPQSLMTVPDPGDSSFLRSSDKRI